MTTVHISLGRDDGTDQTAAKGVVEWEPTTRREDGTMVILERGFTVPLVAGEATVTVDPSGLTWCWRVTERTDSGGTVRYVSVPDSAAVVEYVDLPDVDPTTLAPTADPEAAWWAMAGNTVTSGAVVGDDLILTRYDASTVNAGNVRGSQGDRGPKGDTGDTGPAGPAGGVTSVDGQTGDVSLSSTYVAQANLTVTPGASVSGSNTGDQTLPTWTTLAEKPAVVAAGATQADARTAIGAGTSNLTIGTTSTTAKAGNYTPPDASTTAKGIVELATTAETTTGTDTTRAVTPAGLKAVADTKAPALGSDENYVTDAEKVALHTHANKTALDQVSGINTGDQDLSGYATIVQPRNTQTGTSYTLVASDAGKLVTLDNAGAITVTVPANTITVPADTVVRTDFLVLGAGMPTFVGSGGMTVNADPSLVADAQYAGLSLLLLSGTSSVLVGRLATP